MKFKKTSEQLPELGKEVVIRYKYYVNNNEYYGYYVCVLCYRTFKEKTLVFEEGAGDQYYWWNIKDVEGWMYTSELDNIEYE